MAGDGSIRWGILGTANIARAAFLPGLREAGGGRAVRVAGREAAHAEAWAREHGVESAVVGYERVLEADDIDAVYIPLPNTLHAHWTRQALAAGKAVLTEKPLCVSVPETEAVLADAAQPGRLLWEAFVFPFHPQMERVRRLIADGAIGELREIQSGFHFPVRSETNIRLRPDLAGGALNDVGCYPLHLAAGLFGEAPAQAVATSAFAPTGVDRETRGVLGFSHDRALVFSCGIARGPDTATRLLGTEGEIRLTNPFHPSPDDVLEWRRGADLRVERPTAHRASFSPALRHIHAVLRGEEAPRHLAVTDALATAQALAAVRAAAGFDQAQNGG
jgi:predicted dehydrogenase